MDEARATRFVRVMSRITKHVRSLNSAAMVFPQIDMDDGEMDPRATVTAFCRQIIEDINLVYGFIENEEPAEQSGEGGE